SSSTASRAVRTAGCSSGSRSTTAPISKNRPSWRRPPPSRTRPGCMCSLASCRAASRSFRSDLPRRRGGAPLTETATAIPPLCALSPPPPDLCDHPEDNMDLLLPPGTELPDWADSINYGKARVIDGLPNHEYHSIAARSLVSKGALDRFSRSPAHYLHYLTNLDPEPEKSDALILGAAFHCLLLEPEVFEREYVLLPDFGDMRSSTKRAIRDKWIAERPGVTPLRAGMWRQIHDMRESVLRHKKLRRILENGRPELTCIAMCPHTGLPRKCRFDWVSEIDGLGLDLKSAIDGCPDKWRREAANRRYHVQDTYYTETAQLAGIDMDIMGFGVVEKEPPYVCGLYT